MSTTHSSDRVSNFDIQFSWTQAQRLAPVHPPFQRVSHSLTSSPRPRTYSLLSLPLHRATHNYLLTISTPPDESHCAAVALSNALVDLNEQLQRKRAIAKTAAAPVGALVVARMVCGIRVPKLALDMLERPAKALHAPVLIRTEGNLSDLSHTLE